MTFEEFKSSEIFNTIIGPYAAPATEAARQQLDAWVKLIFAATCDWRLATFEIACAGVIRNMGRGQKPMPEDWKKALDSGRGENLPGAAGCDSCNQTGFVYVQMVEAATGRRGEFTTPCPKCRLRHPLKDAHPRSGWLILDEKIEPRLTRMAHALGSKGAQYVIDQIDAKVVTMPEDVVDILVSKHDEMPR